MDKKSPAVANISFKNGEMTTNFSAYFRKDEGGGVDCFIPGFDIYFSSPSEEEADRRIPLVVGGFFKYWLENESWKKFVLELAKLGFRPKEGAHKLKEYLEGGRSNATFNAPAGTFPENYERSKEIEQKMSVA